MVEDASSGVQAARAGNMAAVGVARLDDRDLLAEAGADLVVGSLDDVAMMALASGRLVEGRAVAELRRRHTERPASVWTVVYEGFDPGRQGLREALCAVGNGYFVTRAALPEAGADEVNYPGTYVAGLYNRTRTKIAGRTVENEDLVNVPNWLPLSFRVTDGPWFDMQQANVLDQTVELACGASHQFFPAAPVTAPGAAGASVSERAAQLAARADQVALCLDFDGTLSPIVPDPEAARPLEGVVELLGPLADRFAAVALVSGRPAGFLAEHAAAPGVRYLGLYGLEEIRDGQVWVDPRLEAGRPAVEAAQRDLREHPAVRDSGAFLEDKRYAVAVHIRRVADPGRWAGPVGEAAHQVACRCQKVDRRLRAAGSPREAMTQMIGGWLYDCSI